MILIRTRLCHYYLLTHVLLYSGGRDSFKWEDVKDNQHRENYLGHSLMARTSLTETTTDLHFTSTSVADF